MALKRNASLQELGKSGLVVIHLHACICIWAHCSQPWSLPTSEHRSQFLLAWITLYGGNCHWDLEPILQMKILCLEKGTCLYLFVDPLAGLMPNSGTYFTLAVLLLRNFARI